MRISVVIPALNESEYIEGALRSASAPGVEIIVADGGSVDGTAEAARALGAKVVVIPPGRAAQMNAGAAAATGDALVFLHADTRLPENYGELIREALSSPGVVAGAFTLSIDSDKRCLRVIERLAGFRTRRLGMPYGDQGIFVSADAFRSVGGFPDIPIMEDYEFVRRLQRRGRLACLDACAVTSARRWERLGALRVTLVNQFIIAGYALGISPARLARWYRGE